MMLLVRMGPPCSNDWAGDFYPIESRAVSLLASTYRTVPFCFFFLYFFFLSLRFSIFLFLYFSFHVYC
ncbi:hypothetical protein EB796_010555 [Bugula neritina]|uniref:Uncharacterized protein n=1 Tax=Bugula neritina TaxID=10212 RepID=A0A7J7JXL5_BUGNE|nr:hypothetical protein EB796_010555 [Bugula neritina]